MIRVFGFTTGNTGHQSSALPRFCEAHFEFAAHPHTTTISFQHLFISSNFKDTVISHVCINFHTKVIDIKLCIKIQN